MSFEESQDAHDSVEPGTPGYHPPVSAVKRQPNFTFDTPVQPVKVSRNQSQYVRQQKGHSLILWLLLGGVVLWIPAIYYTVSPNHFWHA